MSYVVESCRVVRRRPCACSWCRRKIKVGDVAVRRTTLSPFKAEVICDGCANWDLDASTKRRRGGGATGPRTQQGRKRCRQALRYGSADHEGYAAA